MRRHIRNSSAIADRRTGITSGGFTVAIETRPATMRFSIRLLLGLLHRLLPGREMATMNGDPG
jgi:hypothetical protein